MRTRARPGRLVLAVGMVLAFVLQLSATAESRAVSGEIAEREPRVDAGPVDRRG